MTYSINDYIPLSESNKLRLETYYSVETANQLLVEHKKRHWNVLSIAQLLNDCDQQLPLPINLSVKLREQLQNTTGRTVVTGVDGYLALLDPEQKKQFYDCMHTWLDDRFVINAAIMFRWDEELDSVFHNTKYENSLQLVKIVQPEDMLDPVPTPIIFILPEKWQLKQDNVFHSYRGLLTKWGAFGPTLNAINSGEEKYTISVSGDLSHIQNGLRPSITFCQKISDVFQLESLNYMELPDELAELLILSCKRNDQSLVEFLKKPFEDTHFEPVHVFERLYSLLDQPLWLAYAKYLQKKISPDCGLAHVLAEKDLTSNNFLRKFAVDIPFDYLWNRLQNPYSTAKTPSTSILNLPEHRKKSLLTILSEKRNNLASDFVQKIHDFPSEEWVLEFLNLDTNEEFREIVRRVFELSEPGVIPPVFLKYCPLLKDYLSDYDYGFEELNSYFKEYRQLRATNKITPEFVHRALEATIPDNIETRTYKINSLKSQTDIGLMVMDGLGAEYLPFLTAQVRSESLIQIDSCYVVKANLPTSTSFNTIEGLWPSERFIDKFQELDNIAHYSAVKGNDCSPEENLIASLVAISGIVSKIKKALQKYPRVILTADHGLSRLAVLAYENELTETLPREGDDWRYVRPVSDTEKFPEGLENKLVTGYDSQGQCYWIVRGYNRLKKSGGKYNEIHGGATLEEQLTPFIVFSKGNDTVVQKPFVTDAKSSSVQTSNAQIEEDDLGI